MVTVTRIGLQSSTVQMRVILFGSSGMVGQGVLRECLADPGVTEVITVVRSSSGLQQHARQREVVHKDFTDFSALRVDADACFWCLGVSSSGMNEADYTRITHDYTVAAARALLGPTMTWIFVSGQGADRDVMWARVKKKAEDALFAMPFKAVYVFRPGIIQPMHGIRSRTRLYNILYPALYPVMLVAKLIAPDSITNTERVGQAMLRIARQGYPKKILANPDINAAAGLASA
jgi:uncharacterized protein YbjT (DUF2867 family)